jgi:hypothetical protein
MKIIEDKHILCEIYADKFPDVSDCWNKWNRNLRQWQSHYKFG